MFLTHQNLLFNLFHINPHRNGLIMIILFYIFDSILLKTTILVLNFIPFLRYNLT